MYDHCSSQSEPDPALTQALSLARTGYRLFPVHRSVSIHGCTCGERACSDPGKHPRITKWERSASNWDQKLNRWARRFPVTNWAIACGPSNLLVIDEDTPGEFDRYCRDNGWHISPTFTVKTANGHHFYFDQSRLADQPIRSAVRPWAGYALDVRAAGGYVVAPGSVHSSGSLYTVVRP
jgi:hypothetical protein